MHASKHPGNSERVGHIRLAAATNLTVVSLFGKKISALDLEDLRVV